MFMYLTTLNANETVANASATQYAWCDDASASISVISRRDIVTRRAVITTKLERLITFAITTIMVGIFTRGANISIGIFPALSTDVVEKKSILKRSDALTSEWNSSSTTLLDINCCIAVLLVPAVWFSWE